MKSIILLLMAILLIGLIACSDPQKAPTAAQVQVNIHPQGWLDIASMNFHGKVLQASNFNLNECRRCHGSQYDGGIVREEAKKGKKVSCADVDCHTKPGGPEACNTCHGDFNGDPADIKNVAPPRGLDGETSSTTPAVGAHQAHLLYYQNLSTGACQECHNVPANFAAAGHIDADGKAENPFNGTLVRLKTEGNNRVPNPLYEATTNSCSGTYCHGNWGLLKSQSTRNFAYAAEKMEGSNASPKWTDATTAACGTCHGLPPTGHIPAQLNTCANCHSGVVDATGKIIDKTKHVNGKVNVFGQENPMF